VAPRSGISGVLSDLYVEMFKHAREAGIEPTLVHRGVGNQPALGNGITEVLVPYQSLTTNILGPLNYLSWWIDDYFYSQKVADAVEDLDIDLFHLLSSVTGFVLKRRRLGKPLVMFGWASAAIGETNLPLKAKVLVDFVEVPAEKQLARSIDHIVCVTEAVRDFYVKIVGPERLSVVPGGVDVDLFAPNRGERLLANQYGLEGRFTAISVGRIIPTKGFDTVLEGVRKLADEVGRDRIRLLIVGSPSELWDHGPQTNPYFSMLKEYVASNRLDNVVTFTGPLPHRVLAQLLPLADVFVLGSRAEGMGFVILEAMASGVPVVASHVGGIPEIVDDNEVGFTFPAGDSAELKERLLRLYRDESQRKEMGARARRVAMERYSWEKIMSSLSEVYLKVLRGKPS